MAQTVENLSGKCEALISNTSTTKRENKRETEKNLNK
jgi:hypothetical protein